MLLSSKIRKELIKISKIQKHIEKNSNEERAKNMKKIGQARMYLARIRNWIYSESPKSRKIYDNSWKNSHLKDLYGLKRELHLKTEEMLELPKLIIEGELRKRLVHEFVFENKVARPAYKQIDERVGRPKGSIVVVRKKLKKSEQKRLGLIYVGVKEFKQEEIAHLASPDFVAEPYYSEERAEILKEIKERIKGKSLIKQLERNMLEKCSNSPVIIRNHRAGMDSGKL